MIRLKVCGLRDSENITAVAALQPDYMGFIFWPTSSRYVENTTPKVSDSIKKTGVFVDANPMFVQDHINKHGLRALQFHGQESPEYCAKFCTPNMEIIKAFSVDEEFDFAVLAPFLNSCDYFMFDTKGKLPGGNGYTFDWKRLLDYPYEKPFFLSGGIGIDQLPKLSALLKATLPLYAIDVNSKFETAPAIKNIATLTQFKTQWYELQRG